MVNLYSDITLDKIRKNCVFDKDIPLDMFKSAVMNVLGTSYKNTEIWVRNYEDACKIIISKDANNGWVVNWVK